LSKETIKKIVAKFVDELNSQLKDKNIEIKCTPTAIDWLCSHGYDKKMGARPLSRLIDNRVKSPLSREVLFGKLVNGGIVSVDIIDNNIAYEITEKPPVMTKAEKKAAKAAALALQNETVNETSND
jgi:ATP-dependent Clp protease ATP-binding subunit ClpA